MPKQIFACGFGKQATVKRRWPLASGEVAVHRIDLKVADRRLERLEAVLSPDERERAERFHFAWQRWRFVRTRVRLRFILSRYGAGRAEKIRFSYGPKGKPVLVGDAGLEFNLSHSGDVAVVAVACGRGVGIDVERIRASPNGRAIADRFFSPRELEMLRELPAAEFTAAFYRCWTRKEAYLKALGDGLSLALDSFDVSLERHGRSLLLATRPDPAQARRWRLLDLNVGSGYAAALAVERRVKCVRSLRLAGVGRAPGLIKQRQPSGAAGGCAE